MERQHCHEVTLVKKYNEPLLQKRQGRFSSKNFFKVNKEKQLDHFDIKSANV